MRSATPDGVELDLVVDNLLRAGLLLKMVLLVRVGSGEGGGGANLHARVGVADVLLVGEVGVDGLAAK